MLCSWERSLIGSTNQVQVRSRGRNWSQDMLGLAPASRRRAGIDDSFAHRLHQVVNPVHSLPLKPVGLGNPGSVYNRAIFKVSQSRE